MKSKFLSTISSILGQSILAFCITFIGLGFLKLTVKNEIINELLWGEDVETQRESYKK